MSWRFRKKTRGVRKPEPEQMNLEAPEPVAPEPEPAPIEEELPTEIAAPVVEMIESQAPEVTPDPGRKVAQACAACGAEVEPDSKFCTQCAAPLSDEAREIAAKPPQPATPRKHVKRREIEGSVEPWARKAGEGVSRLPRGVKIGIPVVILIIIAIVVALFTLAATHSQQAAISRYLGDLKVGDFKEAYSLVSHPGGRYGTSEYFQKWQSTTTNNIGQLQSFNIQKRKVENKFFGKLIAPPPTTGTPYVVTMKYRDTTFDVNMIVEEAGGAWPVQNWRLRLSAVTTRLLVEPLGSKVLIDGQFAGSAEPNQDLQDALQLKHFPKDIDGAVDYARKVVKTFQFLIGEFKRLATSLESVTESAQRVVDRFGTSGFTWSDLLNSADSTVEQSKDFGQDVARTAIHVYWIFGGGDDGSIRAQLTRVQCGIDVNNLPEGWHQVTAELPGATPGKKEFIAPSDLVMTLDPTRSTQTALKNTMARYYTVVTNGEFSVSTVGLSTALAGQALTDETNKVLGLMGKGQHVSSQLTDLKYDSIKLLNESIATVETRETWNYTTFQGSTPVASVTGQKLHMVYTIEQQGGGLWKVVECKQL